MGRVEETYTFGPVIISQLSLGTIGVGLLVCVLLYLLVQKTRLGLAMRGTSENLPAYNFQANH